MNAIEDAKVVDLCCGTGALGIEALSKEAKKLFSLMEALST